MDYTYLLDTSVQIAAAIRSFRSFWIDRCYDGSYGSDQVRSIPASVLEGHDRITDMYCIYDILLLYMYLEKSRCLHNGRNRPG